MSLQDVVGALQASTSADHQTRTVAESRLKELGDLHPRFYEALLEVVALADQAPLEVRIQAILFFKNALDRWRKTCPNPIPQQVKAAIRPRLLNLLQESNNTIASTVALCIGKIARHDYDTDWPDLPESLLALVGQALSGGSESRILLHRTLAAMHQVVKVLAANRMPRGRRLSQKIGPQFMVPCLTLYEQIVASTVTKLQEMPLSLDQSHALELAFEIEIEVLLLKVLRKTFMHGWPQPSQSPEANTLAHKVMHLAPQLLTARMSLFDRFPPDVCASASDLLDPLQKHLLGMGKLLRDAAGVLPHIVPPIFEFSYSFLQMASSAAPHNISDSSTSPFCVSLVVQHLVIIRRLVPLLPSQNNPSQQPSTEAEIQLAQKIDPWCRECTSLLVTKFIPMSKEDIEMWESDPEEWMNEEESERHEIAVRPAALRLVSVLFSLQKSNTGAALVDLASSASNAPMNNPDDVWIKEAIFAALSISPSDVVEALGQYKPLDTWLVEDILPTLTAQDERSKPILRQAVLTLLGTWVSEEISLDLKTRIYEALSYFVQPVDGHDVAVRLAAARSIGKFDTWGFEESALLPYYGPAVTSIMELIEKVETIESKIRLMNILGSLIERMNTAIMPHAQQVLGLLPSLWADAGDQQLFKVSILVVVTKLTEAVGAATQTIHPQLASLIAYGVTPGTADYEYLHEEAIQLWRTAISHATALSPELMSLLPHLTPMLGQATDMLPDLLKILQSYCLIDGQAVISPYAQEIMAAYEIVLGGLDIDKVKVVLHTFNTVISSAPASCWGAALASTGCFVKLVEPLSAEDRSALVVSKYLGTLSRLVLADLDVFQALVESSSQRMGGTPDQLMVLIVRSWIDYYDNIGSAKHRKLSALSLARLIHTSNATILSFIPEFIPIWLGVLAETEESAEGDASAYSLLDAYQSDDEEYEDSQTPEAQRKLEARAADPVHTVKLVDAIGNSLGLCMSMNGGQERFFQQYLSGVDPLLLEELQSRLQGKLKG